MQSMIDLAMAGVVDEGSDGTASGREGCTGELVLLLAPIT
jgi:hypothetical protein